MRAGRPRTRRGWIAATATAVVVLAGGAAALNLTASAGAATTRVRYATAALGTVEQTVSAAGTIEPAAQAALSFTVPGTVTALSARVGETVSAGQSLAQLSTTTLSAQLTAAQATLAAAQARAASDAAAGASAATLAADQAETAAAQGELAVAQSALTDADLISPIAGTVAAVNLTPGEQVSGSLSGSPATTAQITVISTHTFVVDAAVVDTEVGQLKAGEQAQIVPDGAVTPVYGVVSGVGLVATTTGGVASYPVTVSVTGDPGGLYPGAGAQVSFVVRELFNVLTVPSAALHTVGGRPVLYLNQGGHRVTRDVTVGLASGGRIQILSGLSAGDQVAVTSLRRVGGGGRRGRFGGGGGGFGGGGGGLGGGGGGG